jgi:hypothetical protein
VSQVRIAKDGLKSFEWDGEIRQYVEESLASFVCRLRCHCSIETGVTLGDIFAIVQRDRALAALIGDYSWCDTSAFHAEALKPCGKPSDLTRLELSKYIEIDEDDAGEHLNFGGIGPPDEHLKKQGITDPEIHWGISLSPVNELASLPVVLNSTGSTMREHQEIAKVQVSFTLLEVLSEIYFEISFHGGPESRDALGEELKQSIAEIEAGTGKLSSLEDLLKEDTIQ